MPKKLLEKEYYCLFENSKLLPEAWREIEHLEVKDGSRKLIICNNLEPPLTRCKKFVRSLVYTPHKTFHGEKTIGRRNVHR
jgi:hypothetical protein